MFGWFKKRTPKPDDAAMLADFRKMRIQIEQDALISEAFARDLMLDAVNSADEYRHCLELVQTEPRAAAMLLSLTARAWLNSSRLISSMKAQEATRTH